MFDVLIRNGLLVDGTGKQGYPGDLAIEGDRIAAIGRLEGAEARTVLDAGGRIVCPGFVDPHSHADLVLFRDDHTRLLEPLVRQGITTFVGGNCGMGVAPLTGRNRGAIEQYVGTLMNVRFDETVSWTSTGQFLDALESRGILLNAAVLAPHALLRLAQLGPERRFATDEELDAMAAELDAALEQGAVGLSAGLQYFPGSQSDTRELMRLGQVVARHDGLFACHLRSYSKTLDRAIDEVVQVARNNAIRAQVSHLFAIPEFGPVVGPLVRSLLRQLALLSQWWTLPLPLSRLLARYIAQIAAARDAGVAVGVDVMPANTGFTHMLAFLPPWVVTGSRSDIIGRLRDRRLRERMKTAIAKGDLKWPHIEGDSWSLNVFKLMGYECMRIMAVASDRNKRYEGMSLVDIAAEQGKHPLDTACDLLVEEDGKVLAFLSIAQPDDPFTEQSFFAAVKDPQIAISTDTLILGFGKPSNLFYGCYPKFLGRYVRDMKLLPIETAIRKITALPAEHFRLNRRGTLQTGYYADLVIFDPQTIASPGSFVNPDIPPLGIEHVFVNGRQIVNGTAVDSTTKAGRVLRLSSHR